MRADADARDDENVGHWLRIFRLEDVSEPTLVALRVEQGIYRSMPLRDALEQDLQRVLALLTRAADDDDTEQTLRALGAQTQFAGVRDVWVRHAVQYYWRRQPLLVVLAALAALAALLAAMMRLVRMTTAEHAPSRKHKLDSKGNKREHRKSD